MKKLVMVDCFMFSIKSPNFASKRLLGLKINA
jgi:hypothetical protein